VNAADDRLNDSRGIRRVSLRGDAAIESCVDGAINRAGSPTANPEPSNPGASCRSAPISG
jgi:hypothetical protein